MTTELGARFDLEKRFEALLPAQLQRGWRRLDDLAAGLMEAYGITVLRLAVALVFIWFGALKVGTAVPWPSWWPIRSTGYRQVSL